MASTQNMHLTGRISKQRTFTQNQKHNSGYSDALGTDQLRRPLLFFAFNSPLTSDPSSLAVVMTHLLNPITQTSLAEGILTTFKESTNMCAYVVVLESSSGI